MPLRLACLLVLAFGVGAAYGQQSPSGPAHTGGTCSGHAAACENLCKDRPIRAGGCSSQCESRRAACMQSGVWEGRVTYTNVTRQ